MTDHKSLEEKTITGIELMKIIKDYFKIQSKKGWENLQAKRLAKSGEEYNHIKYSDGENYLIARLPPITPLTSRKYRLIETGSENPSIRTQ